MIEPVPVKKKKEAHMDEELTGSTQVNRCKELDDVPERYREEYGSPPVRGKRDAKRG